MNGRIIFLILSVCAFPAHADYSGPTPFNNPLPTLDAYSATISGAVTSAIPPGSNLIGKVGIDQTSPGTTNAVQENDSLSLGVNTCSSSCGGNPIVGPFDTTGYKTLQYQVTVAGTGAVYLYGSDDPAPCTTATNWTPNLPVYILPGTTSTAITFDTNYVSSFQAPVTHRCMKLQMTSWTSGTFTIEGYLRTVNPPPASLTPIATTQTATPNSGNQVQGAATGATGSITASLPVVSGRTNFLCGFDVSSAGTSSPAAAAVTVTGLISGTQTFTYYPATTGMNLTPNIGPVCLQASGQGVAISVVVPALGTGSTVSASLWGYYY